MSASPEGTLAHTPEVLKIFPLELGTERAGESKSGEVRIHTQE